MSQLGPNAHGEQLRPGRVADCYLAILLDQPSLRSRPGPAACWWSPPAALLHSEIPQPHGPVLYDILTGHPDRAPQQLVFLADLAVELRAWPQPTWTAVSVSRGGPAGGDGLLARRPPQGLELGGVRAEEAARSPGPR